LTSIRLERVAVRFGDGRLVRGQAVRARMSAGLDVAVRFGDGCLVRGAPPSQLEA